MPDDTINPDKTVKTPGQEGKLVYCVRDVERGNPLREHTCPDCKTAKAERERIVAWLTGTHWPTELHADNRTPSAAAALELAAQAILDGQHHA